MISSHNEILVIYLLSSQLLSNNVTAVIALGLERVSALHTK